MTCPNCGSERPETGFCPHCGAETNSRPKFSVLILILGFIVGLFTAAALTLFGSVFVLMGGEGEFGSKGCGSALPSAILAAVVLAISLTLLFPRGRRLIGLGYRSNADAFVIGAATALFVPFIPCYGYIAMGLLLTKCH